MGTSKLFDSSAAFLFEVPESDSPLVAQELQIGGTAVSPENQDICACDDLVTTGRPQDQGLPPYGRMR
jgi:hypothetical protein